MQIVSLDKKECEGLDLKFKYTTSFYYDVIVDHKEIFSVKLIKKPLEKELDKSFTMKLYEDYLENPSAFYLHSANDIFGYLEIDRESWNNRLRITKILILEKFRENGYGALLINKAKEIAKEENFREVILETQSCNYKAIEFYIKNGFMINGIDLSCYSNKDVSKGEVRLEMVFRSEYYCLRWR